MPGPDTRQKMRELPSVSRLLELPALKDLPIPRPNVVRAAREVLSRVRAELLSGRLPSDADISAEKLAADAGEVALNISSPSMQRAINATGIVLHTGLGRAVLPEAARRAVDAVASGTISGRRRIITMSARHSPY